MFTEAQLRAISKYRHKAPNIIVEETEKDAFDDQTANVNVWDPFLKLVVILDAKGRCVETRPWGNGPTNRVDHTGPLCGQEESRDSDGQGSLL